MKNNLSKLLAIQAVIFSVFLAIVYADRCIIEDMFKPYAMLNVVRSFHWVFFDVLSTVAFASIGLTYVIARGTKSWKIGAAIFLEGIILVRLGTEDLLYYVLFQDPVPSKLPWLNYNPILIATTVTVSNLGLGLSIFLSSLIVASVWMMATRSYKL